MRASNGGLALFTVRLDGSGLTRITPYMEMNFAPCGSFGRQRGSEQSDAYIVNLDGSGLFQLTHRPDLNEGGGAWGTHPITP